MMMGFGFIWLILVVAVVAYLMGWRPENLNRGERQDDHMQRAPLEIVRERYARGDITKEEYERMRADLER
ncbi:MAG: SHOCT domain-containing protein [Chloroflexota bacterium]